MRSLFKILISAVTTGVFLCTAGSLFAMPITEPDADVSLDIGGWATQRTSWFTPAEVGGEQRTSFLTTASEYRFNLTFGTETFTAWAQLWRRFDNSGNIGDLAQQHIQLIWKPMDNLELIFGRLQYLHWTDRAVIWESYMGWAPVLPSGTYIGYVETNDGLDVTFDIGSALRVGAAVFTRGQVSGNDNDDTNNYRTIVPHIVFTGGPLIVRGSFYLEDHETATGAAGSEWSDTDSTANTLLVIDAKFDLGGMFVKADILTRTQEEAGVAGDDTDDIVISAAFNITLGSDYAFVEFSQHTAMDDGAADDNIQVFINVGYNFAIAEGSSGEIAYAQNSNDNGATTGGDDVTASYIGLALRQTF